ncbi:MAG: Valine--tRNA ligase [candidate division BRC1 bacterium ADurb.BinA364]|nr:MAG: Valine--tRNA ligase [candidate division BRC1 bacterium ADurb.BinA364]
MSAHDRLVEKTNRNLESYAFDQYAADIYHFVWGAYCDWYLELVKRRLYAKDNGETDPRALASRKNAQRILVLLLESVCRLLHPAIPYVTEEIWQILRARFGPEAAGGRPALDSLAPETIMRAAWPAAGAGEWIDENLEKRMEFVQSAIAAVRQIRGEHDVSPGEKTRLIVATRNASRRALLQSQETAFRSLIHLEDIEFVEERREAGFAAVAVVEDTQLIVPLSERKREEERKRLEKALAAAEQAVARSKAKLGNPSFAERAPESVVAGERERLAAAEVELAQLRDKLAAL